MEHDQWLEILSTINADSDLSENNVIDRIRDKLKEKHPNVHQEWENSQFNINYKFNNQFVLLHIAAEKGYIKVVEALLKVARINVNEKNDVGDTPLHLAAYNGYKEIVEALLGNGASVNEKNNLKETPLHLAARKNYKEIVEVLLDNGASVNAKDDDEETPLDSTTDPEIKALLRSRKDTDDRSSREESNTSKGDHTTNIEEGNNVENGGISNVPIQAEGQTSTFFDSFFSMLMKPVSLVVLFFGGLISWLFWSNTGKTEEHTQQAFDPLVMLSSYDHDDQNDLHLF